MVTKTLVIEHPIKVEGKSLYAKIKRVMPGVYKVNFYYGKESLGEGTVYAKLFNELINVTRTELEKFLKEVIESG